MNTLTNPDFSLVDGATDDDVSTSPGYVRICRTVEEVREIINETTAYLEERDAARKLLIKRDIELTSEIRENVGHDVRLVCGCVSQFYRDTDDGETVYGARRWIKFCDAHRKAEEVLV